LKVINYVDFDRRGRRGHVLADIYRLVDHVSGQKAGAATTTETATAKE
jgi:hypothetical protein